MQSDTNNSPLALLLPHYPPEHCYLRQIERYDPHQGEMCATFRVNTEDHLHRQPEAGIQWVMGLQSAICLEQLAYLLILRLFEDGQMGGPPFTPAYFTELKRRYLLKTIGLRFDCIRPLLRGHAFSITMRVESWGEDRKGEQLRGILALCSVNSAAFRGEVTFFAPTPATAQILPHLAANRPKSPERTLAPSSAAPALTP